MMKRHAGIKQEADTLHTCLCRWTAQWCSSDLFKDYRRNKDQQPSTQSSKKHAWKEKTHVDENVREWWAEARLVRWQTRAIFRHLPWENVSDRPAMSQYLAQEDVPPQGSARDTEAPQATPRTLRPAKSIVSDACGRPCTDVTKPQ